MVGIKCKHLTTGEIEKSLLFPLTFVQWFETDFVSAINCLHFPDNGFDGPIVLCYLWEDYTERLRCDGNDKF